MEPVNFTVANEDHNLYTYDLRKLTEALRVHKDFVNAVYVHRILKQIALHRGTGAMPQGTAVASPSCLQTEQHQGSQIAAPAPKLCTACCCCQKHAMIASTAGFLSLVGAVAQAGCGLLADWQGVRRRFLRRHSEDFQD